MARRALAADAIGHDAIYNNVPHSGAAKYPLSPAFRRPYPPTRVPTPRCGLIGGTGATQPMASPANARLAIGYIPTPLCGVHICATRIAARTRTARRPVPAFRRRDAASRAPIPKCHIAAGRARVPQCRYAASPAPVSPHSGVSAAMRVAHIGT